ncbi:MAG: hypothetical protein H7336_10540 [Bacteriovorax sp.]|nr:hypothetical protein [Bacteriovorax sp.]
MKFVLFFILSIAAFEALASTYQCRSYETGKIVIASEESHTVKFEDRFGNELDLVDNVESIINILSTGPVITQTVFVCDGVKIFTTENQEGIIKGFTETDDSYMCFIRK